MKGRRGEGGDGPSGAQRELVLLDGLLDPGPQAGLVEGLDQRLLGLVVLGRRLLGLVVGAGLQHLVPQDGRQLDGGREGGGEREGEKREIQGEAAGGESEKETVAFGLRQMEAESGDPLQSEEPLADLGVEADPAAVQGVLAQARRSAHVVLPRGGVDHLQRLVAHRPVHAEVGRFARLPGLGVADACGAKVKGQRRPEGGERREVEKNETLKNTELKPPNIQFPRADVQSFSALDNKLEGFRTRKPVPSFYQRFS